MYSHAHDMVVSALHILYLSRQLVSYFIADSGARSLVYFGRYKSYVSIHTPERVSQLLHTGHHETADTTHHS